MKNNIKNLITTTIASLSIFNSCNLCFSEKAVPDQFEKKSSVSSKTKGKSKIFKWLGATIGGVTGLGIISAVIGGSIYLLKQSSRQKNDVDVVKTNKPDEPSAPEHRIDISKSAQTWRDVNKVFYCYYIFKSHPEVAKSKQIDCTDFVKKCDETVGENSKLETLYDAYQCRQKFYKNTKKRNSLLSDLEKLILPGTSLIDTIIFCRYEELQNGYVRVIRHKNREYDVVIPPNSEPCRTIINEQNINALLWAPEPTSMFGHYDLDIPQSVLDSSMLPVNNYYPEGVISRAWDLFIKSNPKIHQNSIHTAFVRVEPDQPYYMHPSGRTVTFREDPFKENASKCGFVETSNEGTTWDEKMSEGNEKIFKKTFILIYKHIFEEKLDQARKELGY